MAKSLIIAEKPSVAKDISKVLGKFEDQKEYLENDSYVVSWAVGHLVEFVAPEEIDPKYKAWKLEDLPILPDAFQFRAKDKCGARISVINKLMKRKDVDCVINACDAGREGELIFRELLDFCKCQKPTRRLWLQSMTPDAIREAFSSMRPGEDYDNLGDAAKCRSEADWLIGINATRALTKRLRTRNEKVSWSAGRVQTPTLAMLAERELAILSFRPTPFWRLKGQFTAPDGSKNAHTYEGTWYDPSFKETEDDPRRKDWIVSSDKLQEIMNAVRDQIGQASETRKNRSESAPALFDLTTLQREANKRFGMSARSTLAVAQRLYESYKLITYPRTSSKCLPSDYRQPVGDVLRTMESYRDLEANGRLDFPQYVKSSQYLKQHGLDNGYRIFDDSKISDHFAIIPTTTKATAKLKEEEAKIYDLIVRRFLAAFYPAAKWIDTERTTVVNGHHFRSAGKTLIEPGWREVYGRSAQTAEESDIKGLPELQYPAGAKSAAARNTALEEKSEQTKPPARYTEASLLAQMENAGKKIDDKELSTMLKESGGLGTPATRAEIIESLLTRGYIERMDKALRTTTKGIILVDMLKRIDVARLTSPALTGEMEKHLQQVENGERLRRAYMDEITDYTVDIITKTKGFDYDALFEHETPLGECPCCRKGMVYERMRFYTCEHNTGKDDNGCKFIIWKDRSGRYIDSDTAKELVNTGKTGILEGFPGGNNQSYKASLRLNPQSYEVEFAGESQASSGYNPGSAPLEELPVDPTPIGACPFHPDCRVIETSTHYCCEKKCVEAQAHKSGFILPRVVCKRAITREELLPYLQNGKSELLENFTSKFNKPFKGYLVLKPTGRHGFEFLPRAGVKKTEAAEDTGTTAAKRTTRKTAAKTGTAEGTAAKRTTRKAAAKTETAGGTAAKRTARKAAAKTETAERAAAANPQITAVQKRVRSAAAAKKAAAEEAAELASLEASYERNA